MPYKARGHIGICERRYLCPGMMRAALARVADRPKTPASQDKQRLGATTPRLGATLGTPDLRGPHGSQWFSYSCVCRVVETRSFSEYPTREINCWLCWLPSSGWSWCGVGWLPNRGLFPCSYVSVQGCELDGIGTHITYSLSRTTSFYVGNSMFLCSILKRLLVPIVGLNLL